MIEEWKDINGYNGIYQVSNLGNVRNAKRNKILLQDTTKGGYKRVTLYKDGKSKHFQVHRLVAFSLTHFSSFDVKTGKTLYPLA